MREKLENLMVGKEEPARVFLVDLSVMLPSLGLLGLTLAALGSLVRAAPTDGNVVPRTRRIIQFIDRIAVPSAASFYVSNIPDLRQDKSHPLHVYSGHLSSDPTAATLPTTVISAHIFFVLVKARRSADKERVMFWFNVLFYPPSTLQHFLMIR